MVRLVDDSGQDHPIRAWQEHTKEVFSVDWSNLKKDTFVSSSWDGTVKIVRSPTCRGLRREVSFDLSGHQNDRDR